MDETSEMIRENVKKFKRYTSSVINPLTIADLVDEMDAVHIKNVDRRILVNDQYEEPP